MTRDWRRGVLRAEGDAPVERIDFFGLTLGFDEEVVLVTAVRWRGGTNGRWLRFGAGACRSGAIVEMRQKYRPPET